MGEVSIDLVFSLEEHPAALFSGHVSPQRGLQVPANVVYDTKNDTAETTGGTV